MSGSLLPWWGWLLILQAVFVYALFEYVRRIPQPAQPETDNALPELDYTEFDQIRGELSEKTDHLQLRLGTVDRDLRNLLDALGDRLNEMSQLQEERNELVGKQIEAARADAKAANDYSVGKGDALQHLLGELRDAQIEAGKEFESFKVLVERALENTWEQLHQRCEFIDQGFAAILDRERLLELAAEIETVGEELSGPTRGEPMGDRDAWLVKFGGWQRDLAAWSRIGQIYRDGVIERIHDTPKSEYRGKWEATDNLFPDSIAVHDYKTFRIMLRNFYVEQKPVDNCVRMAAFARPSTKGRSAVPRDKDQLPRPPKVQQ